jgi:hypothetical protein
MSPCERALVTVVVSVVKERRVAYDIKMKILDDSSQGVDIKALKIRLLTSLPDLVMIFL